MFDEIMNFSIYNDFFKRRNIIKKAYKKLSSEQKQIYRMYLYSQRELSTNKLDLIWEFLNEPDNSYYCPKEEDLARYFVKELEHEIKYNDDYPMEDENNEY